MKQIRQSPSGPVIATVDAGMVTRQAQRAGHVAFQPLVSADAPILPFGGGDFVVGFAGADALKHYGFNARFRLSKVQAIAGKAFLSIECRVNAGAWVRVWTNTQIIDDTLACHQQDCSVDMPLTLGSDFGLVVGVAAVLEFRAVASAQPDLVYVIPDSAAPPNDNHFWISLAETL